MKRPERIVFVHIPRSGGHSVFKSLIHHHDFIVGKGHNIRSSDYEKTSDFIKNEDFVFTFVRNPYERENYFCCGKQM